MDLNEEARCILEILVKEYDETPETRLNGIPFRVLGARAGAYLDFPLHSIAELKSAGFVRELRGRKIVLTEKGYQFAKPGHRNPLTLIRKHPVGALCSILTILSIRVGIALLMQQGG